MQPKNVEVVENEDAPVMASDERVQELMELCRYNDGDDIALLEALLAEAPELVNAVDDTGRTGLHMAAANGHLAVVCKLLSLRPTPNAANSEGNTALHYAAENNYVEIAKALLANGWTASARNRLGRTPMTEAANKGYDAMDALLLQHDETVEQYQAAGASATVDDDVVDDDDDIEAAAAAAGNPPVAQPAGTARQPQPPVQHVADPSAAHHVAGLDELE
jgi:ankyrin repeat protein